MLDMDTLKFDSAGLIPAIVQDFYTGEVLTLAYMNRESLEISLREKQTCFWSRSRQTLWRKGESSGNTQRIVAISADCDRDALVVQVLPAGPACHTGAVSCFYERLYQQEGATRFSAEGLFELLQSRRAAPKEGSYTTYLFEKGLDKILKKVGEEATEVVIAAKNPDAGELLYEIADLAYHTMVLMVEKGISLHQVKEELAGRHVIDQKAKQERETAGQ